MPNIIQFADRDGISSDPVPKWRLSELWTYFEERGIDSKKVRSSSFLYFVVESRNFSFQFINYSSSQILESIEEVIVKAFIACEKHIRDHMLKQIHSG